MSRTIPFHKVHVHRAGAEVKSPFDPRQRLAILTIILLNGMLLGVLGWAAYTQLAKRGNYPEKLLHIASASSKLKETSAEPVWLEMPAATKQQEPVERISVAPPPESVPKAPSLTEPPHMAQVDAIPLALDWEPILVYSSSLAHHQGDSPMIRNWKSLELAALLAAAFTAQPVLFAGEGKKDDDIKAILKRLEGIDNYLTKDLAKVFDKIGKDYDGLRGDVLKAKVDLDKVVFKVDSLEEKLDKLHAELEKLKKRGSGEFNPTDKAGLDDIKSRLEGIEKALAKLQAPSRIALSPPNSGRIMLVNLYPEELLFVVNGRSYRVAPNRTMPLENHPAGALTYEVIAQRFGLIAQKTSTLDPNETFTITAR